MFRRFVLGGYRPPEIGRELGRKRVLVVPGDIALSLEDKVTTSHYDVAALMTRFTEGWMISVSRHPGARVDLKPLTGTRHIWSLAIRRPRPGWRMLGRFAAKDLFVALALYDRHQLPSDFSAEASAAAARWDRDFPAADYVQSWVFADVIGHTVRDEDDDQ